MSSRTPFVCANCARALRSTPKSSHQVSRLFSTTSERRTLQDHETPSDAEQMPRWKQTPPAMQMPIRLRPKPRQPVWRVNTSDELVNEVYDRFVGRAGEAARGQYGLKSFKGSELLSDDVKWLAITHKSFDHGRQGFNDRLAFLGKRIVDLQCSLALLQQPVGPSAPQTPQHEALRGVDNINLTTKDNVLHKSRMATLANNYGIDRIVRWKPRKSSNLESSGVEAVLTHAVYSIIGALAMQRGGEVATKVARERVLQPLGLR
ncbi:hypothetical protein K431DRAFT_343154 [Polychaeton citri CBS 116435]|uniref:RNase III domain-containing protein n=1 Tax=Polychaeton citri CBS 116435 TaxID=1314669 RepID=A0A9P4UUH9_9PEZI|nr:hypothetical protein K431DRAFT_343154 [Polychaeton citri CBS 116435]